MHKAPEFLEKTNYKNPADPKRGPLQYAYNTPLPCWEWLAENPDALKRFNTFMEGSRANRPHWADFFPVQEQLLDGAVPDRPLVVDIGGGRGHDLTGFKQRFSEVKGTLVLEDLPAVIDDIKSLDPEIKKLKHDFFTPQPVKGLSVLSRTH